MSEQTAVQEVHEFRLLLDDIEKITGNDLRKLCEWACKAQDPLILKALRHKIEQIERCVPTVDASESFVQFDCTRNQGAQ